MFASQVFDGLFTKRWVKNLSLGILAKRIFISRSRTLGMAVSIEREGTAFDSGGVDVFGDRFRSAEMNPLGFGSRALELKAERRFVAFLKEIGNVEFAARFNARAGIKIKLQDGAVAYIEQGLSSRHAHQLPRACFREGACFIDGIGRFPRNKLRMGGIRHGDGQPKLGRSAAQELIERRQRGNPPVNSSLKNSVLPQL
jgi:hypothetical protein